MSKDESALMRQFLEAEIARLSAVIGLTGSDVPDFVQRDGAWPFMVVAEDGALRYLAVERGQLVHEQATRDPAELLYWAFSSATYRLASRWVLKHPRDDEEQRVTRWRRQATLLHAIHPEWAERWRAELIERLSDRDDHQLVPALPPPPLVLDPR
ncbi:Imm63 family immunity protein [Kitasatospora sp. NPDC048545]|uniref:Imm63 family immunity protein n=1 Tax=Kitasatospora sp. NPDC048545 TaxID=3157208 RepID=UPI0033D73345